MKVIAHKYTSSCCWVVALLALLLWQTTVAHAQQPSAGLIPYDNFEASFLDPVKWGLTNNWCGSRVLECVREIQNNSLRLEVRSFGATDSNDFNVFGDSELHFASPGPIRTIAAQLTVRRTSVSSCPANTDVQSMQTLLQGTFFNSGTGDPYDDVQAFLDIEHYAGEPVGQLDVIGFLHWQGQFFGGVGVGTTKVGQPVTARLRWDQPNSQFVLSWTDVDSGKTSQAVMRYTMSDSTPPALPDKLIAVRTFAPNCVGTSMPTAFGETKFDTVWVGM